MGLHSFLEEETAFFDDQREELLLRYPNRVLLIKGRELIGDFDSESPAIAEGVRRFGSGPFLVRRSGDREVRFAAPALTLGLS